MANEIEAYQDASSAVQRHEAIIAQTIGVVQRFANSAGNNGWKRVVVVGIPMPAELSLSSKTPSFDPTVWPAGESIGKMLAEWHKLKQAEQAAWDRTPKDRRVNLRPPT